MDQSEIFFNADLWAYKAFEDFVAYKDIYELANNQNAMDTHKESMDIFAMGPGSDDEETIKGLKDQTESSIRNSLYHFAAQTVISLCTTYEVATKQFFECLFIKYPTYMHNFLGESTSKGKIYLNDVIQAGDYKKFISETAKKAASVATKGKYGETINRAQKLCKNVINEKIAEKLNTLQYLRNKIVHEKYIHQLTFEEVGKFQDLIMESIELLMKLSIEKKLPGRYTYVEPECVFEVNSFTAAKPPNT